MRETSDEQLMQDYGNGDAMAFDQLYNRHRSPLYRFFKRQINDIATANDLYQEVWEKIIKARQTYRPDMPFKPWMYRIAHNHLVDHFRRSQPDSNALSDTLADRQPGPAQKMDKQQHTDQLLNGISALPTEQQTTLLLKLESGLKLQEIATVTGVNRETVKSRLRYAVDKLRRSLME